MSKEQRQALWWAEVQKKYANEFKRGKRRERDMAYRAAHREERLAREKARYKAKREEILARQKAYYKANREEKLAKAKARYVARKSEYRQLIDAKRKAFWAAISVL